MDQTSTSFYQHDTQTYTPNTTSGELKATGRLNHNLQEKNTGQEYSEDLPTEDDTPQMATRAKAMTMSTQLTPQEIQEHNITHMPYRSWCRSCVQAKAGKQITRSRHRGSQSCKLISPTSPVLVTSFPHRYLQQSTYKQAWQWQQ